MSNIFIIDDDKELTSLLKEFFSSFNFTFNASNEP